MDADKEPLFGLRALNLLWATPLAAAIQFASLFVAKVAWCGLQNCGTRLSGSSAPDVWGAVVYVFLGALFAAVVLVIAPWTRRVRVRLITPPILTGIVGLLILVGLAVASAL